MTSTGRVGPDHAQKPAELQIFSAVQGTHRLERRRVAARSDDEPDHLLFMAVPTGTAPDGGWPVLYMLDGNAAFDYLTPAHLEMARGLMIVGIGYDIDRQFARERRTMDFTAPDGPGDGLRPDPVHPGRTAGGAARFLERLTSPLRRAAEEGNRVDPARRTLWGHSFGGLFTLYAALTQPDAFAGFATISPSIWWDEALIRRVACGADVLDAAPPMLAALGDKEKRSGSDGPPPDGPAPATMRFLDDLTAHPGYRPEIHVLKDHIHIQTLAGSYPLVFPFALRV